MDYSLPFLWVLNGFLALVYILAERVLTLLLFVPLGWLLINLPRRAGNYYQPQYRTYLVGSSGLAILASVLAPTPVPFFLLVMTIAGVVALLLEHYNPASTYWSIIGGVALYALLGLGFAVLNVYLGANSTTISTGIGTFLTQGQNYLGIMIAFAMYGYPIGYLVLLAKGIFVHAPTGRPDELIEYGRTRNWK